MKIDFFLIASTFIDFMFSPFSGEEFRLVFPVRCWNVVVIYVMIIVFLPFFKLHSTAEKKRHFPQQHFEI